MKERKVVKIFKITEMFETSGTDVSHKRLSSDYKTKECYAVITCLKLA